MATADGQRARRLTWEWRCEACEAEGVLRSKGRPGLLVVAGRIEAAHAMAKSDCARVRGSSEILVVTKREGT